MMIDIEEERDARLRRFEHDAYANGYEDGRRDCKDLVKALKQIANGPTSYYGDMKWAAGIAKAALARLKEFP
jgi:hypothetical protein